MNVNEAIIRAVTPIVPVCVPDLYRPDAGEEPAEVYCTFNYTERGALFGDDRPQAVLYSIQLHLHLPTGRSPISLKRGIRGALLDAGFAVGDVTNATDTDAQHYVFECEWIEAVSDGL